MCSGLVLGGSGAGSGLVPEVLVWVPGWLREVPQMLDFVSLQLQFCIWGVFLYLFLRDNPTYVHCNWFKMTRPLPGL